MLGRDRCFGVCRSGTPSTAAAVKGFFRTVSFDALVCYVVSIRAVLLNKEPSRAVCACIASRVAGQDPPHRY